MCHAWLAPTAIALGPWRFVEFAHGVSLAAEASKSRDWLAERDIWAYAGMWRAGCRT